MSLEAGEFDWGRMFSGSDAAMPHPPRGARTGEPRGEEDESRMCADLQRSCTPAASRRVVNGNPEHAQTGLQLSAGLCVFRVPVHTRAQRGHDRSPTADWRARPRRTIRGRSA